MPQARSPYMNPQMLAWLQAMQNAGSAQAAEKARLIGLQAAPQQPQEVLTRDLGGPSGPPPATNRYQVALSEQPWQTEIYRGGRLSEVNVGRAHQAPLQVAPGGAPGGFEAIEATMAARVRDLTAKSRRFDPVAQQRWQQFTADQAKIEAWAKDFSAMPGELFDVKSQLFKKFIEGFDWDSHVLPNGQMVGDVIEDGLWLRRKTKDGFEFAGWNYKLPDEQRAELAKSLIQPIVHGGRVIGYAVAEEARGKVDVEWIKDDPTASWDHAQAIQESEANLQQSFQTRYGRAATPVEVKQILGQQLGRLRIPVPQGYFDVTPEDVEQSVIEWGQYVQQHLTPGLQQVLSDPIQAAVFSWSTQRGRRPLRKWVSDGKGGGSDGEPIVVPRAVNGAIRQMLGGGPGGRMQVAGGMAARDAGATGAAVPAAPSVPSMPAAPSVPAAPSMPAAPPEKIKAALSAPARMRVNQIEREVTEMKNRAPSFHLMTTAMKKRFLELLQERKAILGGG